MTTMQEDQETSTATSGSKAHPWTEKILEILSDGEWHNYKDVRDQAARLVPPGIAFRKAEANRVRHYQRQGREVMDRKYGSRDDTVLSGQRAFVNKSLTSLIRRGRVEVEYGTQPTRKRAEKIRLAR